MRSGSIEHASTIPASSLRKQGPIRRVVCKVAGARCLRHSGSMGPCFRRDDSCSSFSSPGPKPANGEAAPQRQPTGTHDERRSLPERLRCFVDRLLPRLADVLQKAVIELRQGLPLSRPCQAPGTPAEEPCRPCGPDGIVAARRGDFASTRKRIDKNGHGESSGDRLLCGLKAVVRLNGRRAFHRSARRRQKHGRRRGRNAGFHHALRLLVCAAARVAPGDDRRPVDIGSAAGTRRVRRLFQKANASVPNPKFAIGSEAV
jgi:hypothetical protein